ncbi:MAG TPA: 50S ribosomal protein L24 [Rhabdochlamydiaceae bacterium]|nr:50S ribosomal protein L24 [Rhabdochlamydiaceae bacterium]
MSKWIRKGDKVLVTAGNERGKMGTVLSRKEDRVVVQGLNIRKKHAKRKTQMDKGIIEVEMPIHASNLAICSDDGKRLKLKVKFTSKDKKQLVYMDKDKEMVYRDLQKD